MAQRGNGAFPHHLIFRNNIVHDYPGAGIGTSYADYVTVQQNIVYNTSWWSKWGTSGISIYELQNTDTDSDRDYHNFVLNNVVGMIICKCRSLTVKARSRTAMELLSMT